MAGDGEGRKRERHVPRENFDRRSSRAVTLGIQNSNSISYPYLLCASSKFSSTTSVQRQRQQLLLFAGRPSGRYSRGERAHQDDG